MENCSYMAGIVRVETVPSWGIERIRRVGGQVSLELAAGVAWDEIGCAKAEYSETAGSGDAKSRTLKCTLSISAGAKIMSDIEAMTEERYTARVTDGRGVQWIVGDDQEPLAMTWNRTNEGEADGRDDVTLTFSSEGRWGAMELRIGN